MMTLQNKAGAHGCFVQVTAAQEEGQVLWDLTPSVSTKEPSGKKAGWGPQFWQAGRQHSASRMTGSHRRSILIVGAERILQHRLFSPGSYFLFSVENS